MTERRSILSAKPGHRPIGYIVGDDVFDLSGRKRCRYNGDTGNLHDIETGQIVGYVSLDGRYAGSSFEAQRLFERRDKPIIAVSPGEETEPKAPTVERPSSQEQEGVQPVDIALTPVVEEPADASFERALSMLRGIGKK